MRRRELLGLVGTTALLSCDRAPAPPPRAYRGAWQELSFAPSTHAPDGQHALVLVQRGAPLLVALHGRGEVGRGLRGGARGWRDYYDLDRAHERLLAPPLTAKDLLGFVRPERLSKLNASLRKNPYRGLCVACPYTPALPDRSVQGSRGYARFLIEELSARVRKQLGAQGDREQTGIDGVSMGGRLALLVGLSNPQVFGAVGSLQPAIAAWEAPELSALAAEARAKAPIKLRLVTSDKDYFRTAIEQLSRRLDQDQVPHELLVTPGPHDYDYNRGPGSFEMLQWHDRVLRGLEAA